METKLLKATLIVIAVGIWAIVLQNAGVIPTTQDVEVTNRVDVRGSMNVDNTVGVNLRAINGKRNAFYDFNGNNNFVRIPVYTGR